MDRAVLKNNTLKTGGDTLLPTLASAQAHNGSYGHNHEGRPGQSLATA